MPVCISTRLGFFSFTTTCSDNTNLSQAFNCTIKFPPVYIVNAHLGRAALYVFYALSMKKSFLWINVLWRGVCEIPLHHIYLCCVVFGVQVQIMLIWDSRGDSICLELHFCRFYVWFDLLCEIWISCMRARSKNLIRRWCKFTYRTLGRLESIFGLNLLLNLLVFLKQTTTLSTIMLVSLLSASKRRAPLWPTAWTTWLRKVREAFIRSSSISG